MWVGLLKVLHYISEVIKEINYKVVLLFSILSMFSIFIVVGRFMTLSETAGRHNET